MNIVRFEGSNEFLVHHLQQIYNQKIQNPSIPEIQNLSFYLIGKEGQLEIKHAQKKFLYHCPVSVKEIFSDIHLYLTFYQIMIGGVSFFPFKNLLKKNNQILKLNFIHNRILSLLVFSKGGIHKEPLYKSIWPNDFEISPSKLDTHFTNLKDMIESNFKINFNIKSYKGLIELLID